MRILSLLWSWVLVWVAVSLSYLAAAWISLKLIGPLQSRLLPELGLPIALIYLPHGVRVLTAWLYGWVSIPLLIPAIALNYCLLMGNPFQSSATLLAISLSSASAFLAFSLLRLIGQSASSREIRPDSARIVLLAALLASLFNSAVPGALYGLRGDALVVFLVGDVTGAFLLMIILMLVFRWWRLRGA